MGEEKWRPDKTGVPEAGEIRRGRWEGLSGKSRRGAEGDHLAHSGRGPAELPSWFPQLQSPTRPRGSWGHRREAGEIRSGRWEGPLGRRGRGVVGNGLLTWARGGS